VTKHLQDVSEGTGVGVVGVVGGLAEVKQARLLKRRPAVVVATPGRLWEMRASHEHLRDMSGLRFLVIDEADR
jgi:ATP-dependent RNA helicase DDX24/MAK5